jgi:DNA polymerase (family 10)
MIFSTTNFLTLTPGICSMRQPVGAEPRSNEDSVAVFNEIADLREVEDPNPFRVRAYRNAARVLGG